MALEERLGEFGDARRFLLEGEMAGVEQVQFRIGHVAKIGARTGFEEEAENF